MCKFNSKNDGRRMDPCMNNFIKNLNILMKDIQDLKIVACCCGHRKYPMTIIMVNIVSGKSYDLVSSKTIPRNKRFYKKDKQGYYYILETIQSNQRICECGHKQWDEHKSSFYEKNKDLKMVAQECNVKRCKCKKFKFCKKDKQGYYYIPEVSNEK